MTSIIDTDVLVWPKDIIDPKGSTLIGWTISVGNEWPVSTMIVAGCTKRDDARRRVQEIKSVASSACGKDGCVCSNCMQSLCMRDLHVLGEWGILVDRKRGFPWFRNRIQSARNRLLYYDRRCLYRHDDSFFSRQILTRLSHAVLVMDVLEGTCHKNHTHLTTVPKWLNVKVLERMSSVSLLSAHLSSPRYSVERVTDGGPFQSRYMAHEMHLHRVQVRVRFWMNRLLSLLLCVGILYPVETQGLKSIVAAYHARLCDGILWLESFPVGFKLNSRLTHSIGYHLRALVNYHETILSYCCDSLRVLPLRPVVALLPVLGSEMVVALMFDVLRVCCLHVGLMYSLFRSVLGADLYLIAALWRLFRGKKRNVLRHRTDTMEYDSMQLLLGTILFAVSLFLFTTILVYFLFFTALHVVVSASISIVLAFYENQTSYPWGEVIGRFLFSCEFAARVSIEDMSDETTGSVASIRGFVVSVASIMSGHAAIVLNDSIDWNLKGGCINRVGFHVASVEAPSCVGRMSEGR